MALLNGQDLIDAGWRPSPQFRDILEAVTEAESRGVRDRGYLLKLLERDFPRGFPSSRDSVIRPLPAARPSWRLVRRINLAGVRRAMGQLLRTPVIEAGAILPDACPAGPGEAVIPPWEEPSQLAMPFFQAPTTLTFAAPLGHGIFQTIGCRCSMISWFPPFPGPVDGRRRPGPPSRDRRRCLAEQVSSRFTRARRNASG